MEYSNPPSPRSPNALTTIPNLLSLSRVPLSALLFACIGHEYWLLGLGIFAVAALTDWLDGWWARRFNLVSMVGRSLDPLTDKVLLGGAFIYLIPVPEAKILPWMVTVVIGRELLVTGLRGMVETLGGQFGADWFGKLKTVLQFAVVAGVLIMQSLRPWPEAARLLYWIEAIYPAVLYAMLAATVGSGLQYVFKGTRLLAEPRSESS